MKYAPFKPARFLHERGGFQRLRSGWPRSQWVLSRELYRFLSIRLPSGLGASQRQKALRLQLLAASPYPETDFRALWHDDQAQVWFWDRAAVEAAQRTGRRYQVLPQTLLQQPLEEGLRLLETGQGMEGQFWREGALQASRFWRSPPEMQAWLDFQRQAGVPAEIQQSEVPSAQRLPWLERPYAGVDRFDMEHLRTALPAIWAGAALVLALFLVWYGVALFKYRAQGDALEAELEQQQGAVGKLLATRRASTAASDRLTALRSEIDRPDPLQLMHDLLQPMPLSVTVAAWKQQGQSLAVTFQSADVLTNTADLIGKLQQLPYIETVTAEEAKKNRLRLRIVLSNTPHQAASVN